MSAKGEAPALEELDELAFRHVLRAVEGHMLEKMRNPRFFLCFIPTTYFNYYVDCYRVHMFHRVGDNVNTI